VSLWASSRAQCQKKILRYPNIVLRLSWDVLKIATCWQASRVSRKRCHMQTTNANAHRPTLRLDLTVASGATRGWMARGSHSFTCHPHVYPRTEWAILHAFRKHSPDGVARAKWRTSGSAYYSSVDLERMKGWVGLVGWPYSGWFTHISGHPSATGRAWTGKVRRSKTGVLPLCHAATIIFCL